MSSAPYVLTGLCSVVLGAVVGSATTYMLGVRQDKKKRKVSDDRAAAARLRPVFSEIVNRARLVYKDMFVVTQMSVHTSTKDIIPNLDINLEDTYAYFLSRHSDLFLEPRVRGAYEWFDRMFDTYTLWQGLVSISSIDPNEETEADMVGTAKEVSELAEMFRKDMLIFRVMSLDSLRELEQLER